MTARARRRGRMLAVLGSMGLLLGCAPEDASPASTDAGTPASSPPSLVYVSPFSHNETDSRYDAYDTEAGYLQYREALLKMLRLARRYTPAFDFQPDWRFLEAARKFEVGSVLASTSGKNVVRYIKEDLGFAVDPHSHEDGGYNYADVVYLIKELGVEPSSVVGGFLASGENVIWEKFRQPLRGKKYPQHTWTPAVLWGAGTANHVGDEQVRSGVWRPKSAAEFLVNDPSANLVNIGNGCYQVIEDLFDARKAPAGKIYTYTLAFFEREVALNEGATLARYEQSLQTLQALEKQGKIRWASMTEVADAWRRDFGSEANIYDCGVKRQGLHPGEADAGGVAKNGTCGDGVCDTIEQQTGLCPADCRS